jgi:hypothetical protein
MMGTVLLAVSLVTILEPEVAAREFPVKMEVVADKIVEGTQRIHVKLTIKKPYFTFANPAADQDIFIPTIMTVSRKDAKISYPPGELVKDETVGDYRIYRGTVMLEAVVKREAGDREPVGISVRLRPMDDRGCFWLERKLKASVP